MIQNWTKIRRFMWLLPIIPVIMLLINSSNFIVSLLLISCLLIIFVVYFCGERRYNKQRYNEIRNECEQAHLAMLSTQRHDAMNDIQVLLGYIRLDKKEKCIEYVEKVKTRAQHESMLAKLNDYELINYINQLKLCNFHIKFEIEYLSETLTWNKESSRFMIAVISCYQKYAINNDNSEPLLSINIALDDQCHIQFEYNGDLLDSSAWKAEIEAEAAELVHAKRLILTIDEQDINSTFLA